MTNVNYGDIIRLFFDSLYEVGIECSGVILRGEADTPAFNVGDVDVPGGSVGFAGGLEHGGRQRGASADLVQFLGAEVICKDMQSEDVLHGVDREVLGQEVCHAGIVDSADGDGEAAVDVGGEVGDGEVVVEGGEFGVFGEDAGDVVGGGGGGEDNGDEEGEGGDLPELHFSGGGEGGGFEGRIR
ncbi:hypothetical protein ACET3Z_020568 [Daucus carota]